MKTQVAISNREQAGDTRFHLAMGQRSKSTPPPNRQLTNSKQQVDDFVGELTFQKRFINIFCVG
jgi:hypothetical protein